MATHATESRGERARDEQQRPGSEARAHRVNSKRWPLDVHEAIRSNRGGPPTRLERAIERARTARARAGQHDGPEHLKVGGTRELFEDRRKRGGGRAPIIVITLTPELEPQAFRFNDTRERVASPVL